MNEIKTLNTPEIYLDDTSVALLVQIDERLDAFFRALASHDRHNIYIGYIGGTVKRRPRIEGASSWRARSLNWPSPPEVSGPHLVAKGGRHV